MIKSYVSLAAVMLGAAVTLPRASLAQTPAPMNPQEDYAKRLRAAELVGPLTSDLFSDSVSLFNGATEFAVVDIDRRVKVFLAPKTRSRSWRLRHIR